VLADRNDPDSLQGLRMDQFLAPLIRSVQELAAQRGARGARGGAGGLADTHLIERLCACDLVPGTSRRGHAESRLTAGPSRRSIAQAR
jgi:hypothetical protein